MNEILFSEIKCMKMNFTLHILFYIIVIIFNFILITKIIFIRKILYYLYLSSSCIDIIYFAFPLLPFSFILSKKISKKNIPIFRLLTLIFCAIAIISGLLFAVIIMINIIESTEFCRECPFNIPLSEISNEKICHNKICILNNEQLDNEYPYEHFCNYDASKNFDQKEGPFKKSINDTYEMEIDSQIICEEYKINDYMIENEVINKYINFCGKIRVYYICKRLFKSKNYDVEEGIKCPENSYVKKLFIICILNILLNLIISFIPWRAQMNNYDSIMQRLRPQQRHSNSLNSTKNDSKIKKEIAEGSFKRVPTEVIIVGGNNIIHLNKSSNNISNDIDNQNDEINSNRVMVKHSSKDLRKTSELENINEKENNKINCKTEQNEYKDKNNNILNPQSSTEIFILKDNKNLKKIKNKNIKINNDDL